MFPGLAATLDVQGLSDGPVEVQANTIVPCCVYQNVSTEVAFMTKLSTTFIELKDFHP